MGFNQFVQPYFDNTCITSLIAINSNLKAAVGLITAHRWVSCVLELCRRKVVCMLITCISRAAQTVFIEECPLTILENVSTTFSFRINFDNLSVRGLLVKTLSTSYHHLTILTKYCNLCSMAKSISNFIFTTSTVLHRGQQILFQYKHSMALVPHSRNSPKG